MIARQARRGQRGFTLIEAVIVIAVTAIIGAIVAVFIRVPVQSYMTAVARTDLTETADTALRRMGREVRLALPNSPRVTTNATGTYLELLATKSGGRYVAVEDEVGVPLQFATAGTCAVTPALCRFEVAGAMPGGRQAIAVNDYIVVYNLGAGMEPASAYADVTNCAAPGCNIARVQAVDNSGATNLVTLSPNTAGTTAFAAQTAASVMASPMRRFHVVSGPVTYHCDTTARQLSRYANYTIQAAQPVAAGAAPLTAARRELLADGVESCDFAISALTSRAGIVTIRLGLLNAATGERVGLFQQTHTDNTP